MEPFCKANSNKLTPWIKGSTCVSNFKTVKLSSCGTKDTSLESNIVKIRYFWWPCVIKKMGYRLGVFEIRLLSTRLTISDKSTFLSTCLLPILSIWSQNDKHLYSGNLYLLSLYFCFGIRALRIASKALSYCPTSTECGLKSWEKETNLFIREHHLNNWSCIKIKDIFEKLDHSGLQVFLIATTIVDLKFIKLM